MKTQTPSARRLSLIALCASLIFVLAMFSVPAAYSTSAHIGIAALEFIVVCTAAWSVGAFAINDGSQERQSLALAGTALILPFALFSLTAGFGTPEEADAAQNQLRYLLLTMDAILVGIGFAVLGQALRAVGDRFYSTLGLIAIAIATPLYVVFTVVAFGYFPDEGGPGKVPAWLTSHNWLGLHLLSLGPLLTYVAMAAFAAALGRTQWLGRTATRLFIGLSSIAVAFVATRLTVQLAMPNASTSGATAWLEIPAFALIIPAVPWMMPCVLGILLLWRAGREVARE